MIVYFAPSQHSYGIAAQKSDFHMLFIANRC